MTTEEMDDYTRGVRDGLLRHCWMRNGITYIGNGTYTLREGIDMAERDLGVDLATIKADYKEADRA